jgi:two-component system LytT family sensor kinase
MRSKIEPMSDDLGRFPSFWGLQLLGWAAFAGVTFVDLIPRYNHIPLVAYDAVFVIGVFLASFVMRLVCRRAWRRGLPWPRAMLHVGIFAALLGAPCGLVAEWTNRALLGGFQEFGIFVNAWGGIVYAACVLTGWSMCYLGIKHYQALQTERQQRAEAEALAREAQLQALRYQLNPHFLFNTLNTISTLVAEGDAPGAKRMLSHLAQFLRVTLDVVETDQIPLSQELLNAEEYLAIEKARLGERLQITWNIAPGTEDAMVPVLLLQPLAENAIRHGIAPRPEGGILHISADRAGSRLRCRISDDGVGFRSPSSIESRPRRGLGLANTIKRLRVLYGEDHCVAVRWPDDGGCSVEIELPYRHFTGREVAVARFNRR